MASAPARFPISDHCDGTRFFNPRHHANKTPRDILRWKFTSRPARWPAVVPVVPALPPPAPARGFNATWIGHATFLLRSPHATMLTDPVFSERPSPVTWAGPQRAHAPGVRFEDLPPVDAVLLSHDHYDHCDLRTLTRLAQRPGSGGAPPWLVTPLGNGALARRAGFAPERIVELDWWQQHALAPHLRVTLTPSRHWSNRLSSPRNGRLWGGFFLAAGEGDALWFAGDTAWDDTMFSAIRARCGSPDLALIPIGAYEPRWFMRDFHCNPAEAVSIHQAVGARHSVAMHWGTWQLTDEAREAPVEALAAARAAAGLGEREFHVVAPGESVTA